MPAPSLTASMNSDQPLVTVITPIYNSAEYLAECIESVLRQTYQNWEYILVDNCSTDGSDRIAADYAARDQRLRLIRNTQFLSQVRNFNSALRHISPESRYCKMVQSDDWIFPECLERMVTIAESDPSVGIVGSYFIRGNSVKGASLPYSTTVLSGRELCRFQLLTSRYVFGSPNEVLYRAEIVKSTDPFFDECSLAFDAEVCYRILQSWNFGFVHQVLSFSRLDNEGISAGIRKYDPYPLDRFVMMHKYAHVYFGPEEAARYLGEAEGKYLRRLASRMLFPGARGCLEYHRKGLATIGYKLHWRKLAKWTILEVFDMLGNPKNTFTQVGRFVWRRLRRNTAARVPEQTALTTASAPRTTFSPAPRESGRK